MNKILIILSFLIISGCISNEDFEKRVKKEFPDSKIAVITPGYKFLVKDSDEQIWYIETGNNLNTNITKQITLRFK